MMFSILLACLSPLYSWHLVHYLLVSRQVQWYQFISLSNTSSFYRFVRFKQNQRKNWELFSFSSKFKCFLKQRTQYLKDWIFIVCHTTPNHPIFEEKQRSRKRMLFGSRGKSQQPKTEDRYCIQHLLQKQPNKSWNFNVFWINWILTLQFMDFKNWEATIVQN